MTIKNKCQKPVKISQLEDAADIKAIKERENEPLISYDEMVKRLKKDGLL
jgi:hypothetical protein